MKKHEVSQIVLDTIGDLKHIMAMYTSGLYTWEEYQVMLETDTDNILALARESRIKIEKI